MNKLVISGNITGEPKSGVSKNDKAWARFTVAVSRPVKNPDTNEYDLTDFFDCTAFSSCADRVVKNATKGTRVAVIGRVELDKYTDKDGVSHKSVTVIADDVDIIGRKKESQDEAPEKPAPALVPDDEDEDIPF